MSTAATPAFDSSLASCRPVLDPGFVPAVAWNRLYRRVAGDTSGARDVAVSLERPDGTVFRWNSLMLPDVAEHAEINLRYLERILKFLLWQKGGNRIRIAGAPELAAKLGRIYSSDGDRAFDWDFIGRKIFGGGISIEAAEAGDLPEANDQVMPLGRHLDGCRIGFDLGGSDRKCAAVIDGEVVFSEEVVWDPYFQSDPEYHLEGIHDSLKRAAAHLPRVDAIGGSSAGVYVNNEVRVASLFRGVPDDVFETRVRRMFLDLQEEWNGVPFVIVNDGDVTALAGSMATGDTGVLGVAMGTSEAVGFVNPEGHITTWLNELAFAPIDYQENAPADEWSGGLGVGAQYLSQQAVGRLAPKGGYDFPEEMPLPERLIAVQEAMEKGEQGAAQIFETVGRYFGYAVAHYADTYDIRQILALGRVTSGAGGDLLLDEAKGVLATEFPELAERIQFRQPGEKEKRHGQAIAAASLPEAGR